MTAALRSIITPTAILRLILGWGAYVALLITGPLLEPPVPAALLVTALIVIIAVILICAFGVVHEAEHLAGRLGDPYGSLVLTISICLIEVILIAAVLLGPGDHATIARDSVMAVSMIILAAVVGLCLLIGGLRHGAMVHNRTGVSSYLVMIVVFAALAFAVPGLIGSNGSYAIWQEIPIIVITVAAYAFFLYRQMGPQAHEFTEVATPVQSESRSSDDDPQGIVEILSTHRVEITLRLILLVATVLPIVLLSHDMATLLDDGLGRLGAPVALSRGDHRDDRVPARDADIAARGMERRNPAREQPLPRRAGVDGGADDPDGARHRDAHRSADRTRRIPDQSGTAGDHTAGHDHRVRGQTGHRHPRSRAAHRLRGLRTRTVLMSRAHDSR